MLNHLAWALPIALLLPVVELPTPSVVLAAEKPSLAASRRPNGKTTKKRQTRVTISKETTYITEPLRPDGYPDYLAALNQRLSKGVTPENNAAVPFWKAMGPVIHGDCRERYFQMLGISPPPEKGDYFVRSNAWIERHKTKSDSEPGVAEEMQRNAQDQMQAAMKRPWAKKEFPLWAEWLEKNEKPMVLLVEACQRPRRYEPLISSKGMLIVTVLPAAQESRECARALVMRAMLRLGEGKVDEAWSDLQNCHRFARLTDQSAWLVDGLVALSIENMAQAGDQAVARYGKLTAAQAAKMHDDLDKLPRMSAMVDQIDMAERFSLLDSALAVAREGPSCLSRVSVSLGDGGTAESPAESLIASLATSAVNWDIPTRMINAWFDRLVAAGRKPTWAERVAESNLISADICKMVKSARDPKSLSLSQLGSPRTAISERVGQILVGSLLPATMGAQTAEDCTAMQSELTKLSFALAAYRADHGSYPATLADLVPKYVKELPKDIFNGDAELHYSKQGDGFLLHSVGPNGKNEGGKGRDDRKNNDDWDDLTVSTLPEAK